MESRDYILDSMLMIKTISDNDLEKMKILINDFNSKQQQEDITHWMDNFIPFNQLMSSPKTLNETLLYVVNNLDNIEKREVLKWRIENLLLLQSPNRDANIENFIINLLENNTTIKEYQMPMLIQMCVTIDRYDLLEQIRIKFANS